MRDPRQRHILVIDDDVEVGALIQDILEEEGYRVSVTTEAPSDPSDLVRDDVDLVILDPGVGGEDPSGWVLQTIEPDHEAIDIPLVVCTGNTRVLRDLANDLEERNINVVEKPFDLDALLQVVDEHVGPSSAFG